MPTPYQNARSILQHFLPGLRRLAFTAIALRRFQSQSVNARSILHHFQLQKCHNPKPPEWHINERAAFSLVRSGGLKYLWFSEAMNGLVWSIVPPLDGLHELHTYPEVAVLRRALSG